MSQSDRSEQASEPAAVDPSAIDPAAMAATIASTPDEQLEAGMQSENRQLVLDEIFRRMEEHFRADKAQGVNAVLHFKILDRPDGSYDHYEVAIADGACKVHNPPEADARVTFKVGPVAFLKLVTGNASGPMLFMSGKLKIEGDVMFAARLQEFFTIPQAAA